VTLEKDKEQDDRGQTKSRKLDDTDQAMHQKGAKLAKLRSLAN
jgi:hypothetical protein